MKGLACWVVLLGLAVPACGDDGGDTGAPCGSDNDCKGDRICLDNGKCSDPGGSSSSGGNGSSDAVCAAACQNMFDQCGEAYLDEAKIPKCTCKCQNENWGVDCIASATSCNELEACPCTDCTQVSGTTGCD